MVLNSNSSNNVIVKKLLQHKQSNWMRTQAEYKASECWKMAYQKPVTFISAYCLHFVVHKDLILEHK